MLRKMNRIRKNFLCLSIVLSFLISIAVVSAASVIVDDYISSTSYPVGSELDVDVYIDGYFSGLYGFDIELSWDSSILQLLSITTKEDDFWSNAFCTDKNGKFMCVSLSKNSYNGHYSTLATYHFKVLKTSTSPLDLKDVKLTNPALEPISVSIDDGTFDNRVTGIPLAVTISNMFKQFVKLIFGISL